jgi:hypothetical protein
MKRALLAAGEAARNTGGTLTSITDALSHTTSAVTFQSGGRPLTVTDPSSDDLHLQHPRMADLRRSLRLGRQPDDQHSPMTARAI